MQDKLVVNVDEETAALVPRFLANRAVDVEKIRTALAGPNFDAIRVIGHGLKGVGTGYGFPEISRIGGAIEDAARSREAVMIESLVADLDGYLGRIEVRYP